MTDPIERLYDANGFDDIKYHEAEVRRLLTEAADTLAYIEAGHRISHAEPVGDRCLTDCTEAWYVERDTLRRAIADVRALLDAADREKPT